MKTIKAVLFLLLLTTAISAWADDIHRVIPINRSSTITLGGTAQSFAAANGGRSGCAIGNPSTNSGSIWISFTGTATADYQSLEILPGELYECPENGVPKTAISIIGGTTGMGFFGEEW